MTVTCFLGHPEIRHEGAKCPLCVALEKHAQELAERDAKILELEGVIDTLHAKHARLERSQEGICYGGCD